MIPGRVVFVVGLTGSGKTELLNVIDQDKFDPIHDLMRDVTGDIRDTDRFRKIEARLKSTKACAIAEIQLCNPTFRQEMSRLFTPMASVEWVWFEKDPAQCKGNVVARWERIKGKAEESDRSLEHEFRLVDHFAGLYDPPRVDLLVYRPGQSLTIPKALLR
jgi:hypothetical protein